MHLNLDCCETIPFFFCFYNLGCSGQRSVNTRSSTNPRETRNTPSINEILITNNICKREKDGYLHTKIKRKKLLAFWIHQSKQRDSSKSKLPCAKILNPNSQTQHESVNNITVLCLIRSVFSTRSIPVMINMA